MLNTGLLKKLVLFLFCFFSNNMRRGFHSSKVRHIYQEVGSNSGGHDVYILSTFYARGSWKYLFFKICLQIHISLGVSFYNIVSFNKSMIVCQQYFRFIYSVSLIFLKIGGGRHNYLEYINRRKTFFSYKRPEVHKYRRL